MSRNLINLLPPERLRAARREYFLRLLTVSLVLLAFAITVHAVLLLPSYIYLGAEQEARAAEAARLARELEDANGQQANQELAALAADAAYLSRLGTLPTASAAVRSALGVPRAGIRITGVTYAPPVGDAGNGKMTLIGIAGSREALRQYESAMRGAPGVSQVDLPIGAYARETNIDFVMTLTGSFRP